LNNPFVLETAKYWAAQQTAHHGRSVQSRIQSMLERAFGRVPDTAEIQHWSAALADFGGDTAPGWEALAHAIFNSKEFIYIR
jgi:hypothetical protein